MPQSRATASRGPSRLQQLAIAVLALLLIALLGFYTLVTGRITDGSARLKDGAGQAAAGAQRLSEGAGKLASGATLADTGAGQLSEGAQQVNAGITGSLAPGAELLQSGANKLAAGAGKIQADVSNKLAPGVYKVDDGARRLANGASQLSAALTPTQAGNAENNLADGATQVNNGAALLEAGAEQLHAGTVQLKGYRGANNDPVAGTGTAALAQALYCCRLQPKTLFKALSHSQWSRTRSQELPREHTSSMQAQPNWRPVRHVFRTAAPSSMRGRGNLPPVSKPWPGN